MPIDAGQALREARLASRLTQRQLAARAGVPQSTVARIERGALVPRVDTFARLIGAAGHQVKVDPRPGFGIDRTLIHDMLALTPQQRLMAAAHDANALNRLLASVKGRSAP